MGKCVFCDIIERKIPSSIVHEDDGLIVFMDNFPINRGHVLVASKQHYPRITETPEQVLLSMMKMVFKVEKALWKSGLKCEGTNILHSHGEAAGQDVFHTHFHIVPRFEDDGFNIAYGTESENREDLNLSAEMIQAAIN